MEAKYDASYVSQFYDQYGEREWIRFERSPMRRVNFHVHRWYLEQYIKQGDTVLEVGAGPGRFTIELAKVGAKIMVGDISPKQLELNYEKVQEAGYEEAVVGRELMDIVNLSQFPSESFDALVCYGGPLSYVFDQVDQAIDELLRVTRPEGYVLLSVMSLLGSTHAGLPVVLGLAEKWGLDAIQQVNETGNLYGDVSIAGHYCHMFRWSELQELLKRHSCIIVAASASNFLSVRNEETLEKIMDNPTLWEAFLKWEVDFCKGPGAIDGGTHILTVVQRTEAKFQP